MYVEHNYTQGCTQQSNGTLATCVGLRETLGPRMLVSATLGTSYWPCAEGHAAEVARAKALKTNAKIIPCVPVTLPFGKKELKPKGIGGI